MGNKAYKEYMPQTQTDTTNQKQTVDEPRVSDKTPQPTQRTQPAAYDKSPLTSTLVEVIDRVLDKGIVIDAWVRVSLVGIEVLTIEARVVIASVETYLRYADALGKTRHIAAE